MGNRRITLRNQWDTQIPQLRGFKKHFCFQGICDQKTRVDNSSHNNTKMDTDYLKYSFEKDLRNYIEDIPKGRNDKFRQEWQIFTY